MPDPESTAPRPIDELIEARWIIQVEPPAVLESGWVALDQGRIIAVGAGDESHARFQPRCHTRLAGHALLPGLINAHTHAAMSLFRGLADDMPLLTWLERHIWPAEQRWVSGEFVRDGARLAVAEMIRSGTTCFVDMYFFPDETARVAKAAGIRAVIGLVVADFPSAWARDANQYLRRATEVRDALLHEPLLTTLFAPHSVYGASEQTLRRVLTLANELDLGIQLHLHESAGELAAVEARCGMRPLEVLVRIGMLGPNIQAVHMTQLRDDEIDTLALHGAKVIHCPESNMKLASGICPVPSLVNAGVNVCLGTDGAASNNDLDLFGEMRTAALLGKLSSGDAAALSAEQVLAMATLGAARTLGLEQEVGSVTPGKAADLIAVDLSALNCLPVYDPVSQLVYAARADQVSDVWVAGRRLLADGKLQTLDTQEIRARADHWRDLIAS